MPTTILRDEPAGEGAPMGRRAVLNRLAGLAVAAAGVSVVSALSGCSSTGGSGARPGRSGRNMVGEPIPPDPTVTPVPSGPVARPRAMTPGYSPYGDAIVRTRWAKFGPNESLADTMLPVRYITVHHDGMDAFNASSQGAAADRLEAIRRVHVSKGWADIGYHYAIDPAGRIWEGRPLELQGAHVKAHNEANIGIVMLGNFELQRPTGEALGALSNLIGFEMHRHRLAVGSVYTHREWAPTACPGANLQAAMERMRRGGRLESVA